MWKETLMLQRLGRAGHDHKHMGMNRLWRLVLLLVIAAPLAGCSSKKKVDPIFANTPAGPKTAQMLKRLPKGLLPDDAHRRYSAQLLLPPDAEPADEEESAHAPR